MIPDPGRCGYQDLVQPLATTNTCCFPRLMSNNDNLLSSITPFFSPLFPSIFLLLSTTLHKCTRATTWGCTRSLTECHDPRIVHHCGIGRNITCRRFHIRLELVQTRTTAVAICFIPYQTHTVLLSNVNQLSRAHSHLILAELVRTIYNMTDLQTRDSTVPRSSTIFTIL